MYQMALDVLGDAGYRLYTLYDFARPGKECLHHAINWQAPQRDYAGFGPGAFSFIRGGEASHIYCNLSDLDAYVGCVQGGRQPVEFGKRLTREEAMSRYMVLGVNFLRVPLAPFRERFGVDLVHVYGRQIEKLASWGLVEVSDAEMALTEKGKLYLANVSKTFFTDENRGMPHVVGVELQKGEGLSLKGIAQRGGEP
jgi:oxygen-independent coproporphyrinogen-3 oxidase